MTEKTHNGEVITAALVLGVASLLSRLVGLVRERVLTTTFGAGDTFDAFVAAFRVPDMVFNLIVIGALSATFIPLFTEKLVRQESGRQGAFRFSLSVLNTLVLALGALSVLYAALAHIIVPLITPGFGPEKMQLTIQLSRVMALQPVLLGISFVFSGILNSFKRFVAYALAPILYNVGIIFGVIVLVPMVGVTGLGWGVVLGAALHLLVQFPSVVALGFRWQPVLAWSSADVRALWRMIVPRMLGLAAQQVNLFVVTIIGSTLLAGSLTAFHLANNVQSLPIGVFGLAFAQAAFPTLAEHMARGERQAYVRTLTRSLRSILFFVIPLSLFFFLLRAQIVRVLFGDGAFDWEDTILTFETLGLLLMSLFAQATVPLLTRAFYVRQDTRTPVTVATISIVVNLVAALLLAPRYGVQGLAFAFSLSAIVNLVLLLAVLHGRLGDLDDRAVVTALWQITAATALGGLVLQTVKFPIAQLVDMQKFWGVFTQLTISGAVGCVVYVLVMRLFGSAELAAIRAYLPRRLRLTAGTETPRFGGLTE